MKGTPNGVPFFYIFFKKKTVRIKQIVSERSGAHQMPSPPKKRVSTNSAPAMAMIPLMRESSVASVALSMAVK